MIVHIGSDIAVNQDDIVMILNLNGEKAAAHEQWLAHMRRKGNIRPLMEGKPKCAVIVSSKKKDAGNAQAILSPVNTATILKRTAGYAWLENADD